MKSPFVRFSQFVRSPLTMVTLGLCTAWGCRHLPGTHRLEHRVESTESVAADRDIAEESRGYEEPLPPTAAIIDPRCAEPPVVKIDAGREFFTPTLRAKDEPVTAKPVVPATPEPTDPPKEPVEEVVPQKKDDSSPTPKELPEDSPVKPAPNGKLDVPPEPDSENVKENAASEEDALKFDEPNPTPAALPDAVKLEDTRLNEFAEKLAESVALREKAEASNTDLVKTTTPVEEFAEDAKPLIVPNTTSLKKAEATEVTPLFASKSPAPNLPVIEPSPANSDNTPMDNEVISLDAHCDGLVFDSEGFGYVSHRDRIVKFSPAGEISVWATLKSPKGHRIEPEGTHLVCDTDRRAVVRLSFEGKVIGVAANECNGAPLRAPHEIAVDPRGGFYFTDPGYVQVKTPIGKLHYVDRLGKVSVVAAKIGFPTGVVYDPVRLRLFVVESQFGRVLEFRLSEPGKIESHAVFAELPKLPDNEYHLAGLCLDADGNLYVTQKQSKTVLVFDVQGRSAGKFHTGDVMPSSVALRSPDADELFFTGGLNDRDRQGKVIRLNLGK